MSTSKTPAVDVVCVLLFQEQRVLLAQRPADKRLGGYWEFPGGKIEPGETAEQALHRELQEELGCQVEVTRALPPCLHDYEWGTIRLHGFVAALRRDSPPPEALEHQALVWTGWDQLETFLLAPADLPVARAYEADPDGKSPGRNSVG